MPDIREPDKRLDGDLFVAAFAIVSAMVLTLAKAGELERKDSAPNTETDSLVTPF